MSLERFLRADFATILGVLYIAMLFEAYSASHSSSRVERAIMLSISYPLRKRASTYCSQSSGDVRQSLTLFPVKDFNSAMESLTVSIAIGA